MKVHLLSISLLLFSFCVQAQTEEIELVLDSIQSKDPSTNSRVFTIHYQIKNKTATPISLILDPNSIRSNVSSSLGWMPSYRLYQDAIRIDAESISSPQTNEKKNKEFIDKMRHELRNNKGNLEGYLLKKQKENLETSSKNILSSILTFQPHESRSYAVTFNWDKNRYIIHYENEYYLDEKTPHYMDLVVILLKDELYTRLLPEDKLKIEADTTIIRGWINSNKLEINFKE